MRRQLLYLCTYPLQRGDLGGEDWTNMRILPILEEHFDVTVAAVSSARTVSREGARRVVSLSDIPLQIRSNFGNLLSTALRIAGWREPYSVAKFRSFRRAWDQASWRLSQLAKGRTLITNGWPAALLATDSGLAPDIHLAQNVEHVVSREFAPQVLKIMRDSGRLAAVEVAVLGQARRVLTFSAVDAGRLRKVGITCAPIVLPMRDVSSVEPATRRPVRIGFIGSISWPPNRMGIEQLVDVVMPALREGGSRPELVIAGRGTERYAGNRDVLRAGPVGDVGEFFREVDLQVILRPGTTTGVSVKLLEATEYGVQSIVSNSLTQAFELPSPWLSVGDVSEIASAYSRFLTDGSHRSRLRQYIRMSNEAVTRQTVPLLTEV